MGPARRGDNACARLSLAYGRGVTAALPTERPLLALVVRIGAIAGLATMSALIKLAAERGVHVVEIMFWRQASTLPILLVWAAMMGGLQQLRTRRLGMHFKRSIYGTVGMALNFGAVILLPLAEATTMNFTAPIWAVILATLLLKERPGPWRWGAVAAGFVGVVLIAQPGESSHIPLVGALVALGGAFMIALISIQIADLGRTDKPLAIVFYFALFSVPITGLALPFMFVPHDAATWWLLAGIGVSGVIGQLLLTAALRLGKVSSVIVMDYSALFWATLYGWLLFDMLPPASTWFGAPIIIAAGLVIAWREHRLSRPTLRAATRPGGT